MNQVTTRGDLARMGLDALDPQKAGAVTVSHSAGGVSFASAMEVMEFAKLMSVSATAVPKHLRNNPGACLRIVFQAIEWRMSPYAVADKSYEVNDRIAYESQLIHAVIEARAPLLGRLECDYEGEGPDRACIVTGVFNGGETREYKSPKIKDIRVKNSPLWVADPDQQLWYYASRSWARKWCPDVLMGIYSREELRESPGLGREEPDDTSPGLHARLAGSERSDEGHRAGHVESELDQVAAGGGKIIDVKPEDKVEDVPKEELKTEPAKKPAAEKKPAASKIETSPMAMAANTAQAWGDAVHELEKIKTPEAYKTHALAWITAGTEVEPMRAQWSRERIKRGEIGVMEEMLIEINKAYTDKIKALQKVAA
jgi:hypothetical protein